MDGWLILKLIWGGIGLAATGLLLIVVWRARGVIAWNRAIRKELKALEMQVDGADSARAKAIRRIIAECETLSRSMSPERAADAERLRAFIRSIAACFFPTAERPELQISLGHLIKSLDASLYRFDRIIHRPGLNRITQVNIKTLIGLYGWSNALIQRPWVKWYLSHRSNIRRFALIRLLILPDPFSWLFLLSRKLLILILLKNLLVDITLFTGKLALDAYDGERDTLLEADQGSIEAALEALSQVDIDSASENDPQINAIRQKLAGFSAILRDTPTWQDWKRSVRDAGAVIARRHFPESTRPMEEAAIGPLLVRTRSLLGTLGRGRNMFMIRYAYNIRLETLFQARDVSDLILTPTVRGIARTSVTAYGWIKWPLKIYRRVKRFSLPGLAADVGWVLGKKSAVALIYGRTFDQACRELDWVYRASAGMGSTSGRTPTLDSGEDASD